MFKHARSQNHRIRRICANCPRAICVWWVGCGVVWALYINKFSVNFRRPILKLITILVNGGAVNHDTTMERIEVNNLYVANATLEPCVALLCTHCATRRCEPDDKSHFAKSILFNEARSTNLESLFFF